MAPSSSAPIETNKDRGSCQFKVLTDCNSPNGCAAAPFAVTGDGVITAGPNPGYALLAHLMEGWLGGHSETCLGWDARNVPCCTIHED
jgi:hypothetical protein